MDKKIGLISGVLQNLCPYCFEGQVFSGFLTLNKRCPNCNKVFLKEEGYFLGSMIAAYFFSSFTVIPVFVAGVFVFHQSIDFLILIGSLQVVILSPILYRYSSILWLWLETLFQQNVDKTDE